MTYHFANILTWETFKKETNQIIKIDGFLLQLFLLLSTGKLIKKESGLIFYHNNKWNENTVYLTRDGKIGKTKEIMLPQWPSVTDIRINEDLIIKLKGSKQIIIAISSPKQDILAKKIFLHYPEKDIYCLGGAVYTKLYVKSEFVLNTLLTMLIYSPKRTVYKLRKSMIAFTYSLIYKRNKAKEFFSLLSED